MSRYCLAALCVPLLVGCAQPQPAMDPFTKPTPPPELSQVASWVGRWDTTAEMVSPSPVEMKQMMPEGATELSSTSKGHSNIEWALGGMSLKEEGWYEMPTGERVSFVAYLTWDPRTKRYRTSYLDDWGHHGAGWLRLASDGATAQARMEMADLQGQISRSKGTYTFPDDDTMQWTMIERGPMGRLTLRGTTKRQP